MKSKPFLIAIAAFAVTASGVQAYGGTELLERAGLSEKQINAFETARERREAGDIVGARDVLIEAGIDEDVIHSVHKASKELRQSAHHQRGFSRHFDILTPEQREALRVAHQANDKDAEEAILEEAGIELHGHMRGHH